MTFRNLIFGFVLFVSAKSTLFTNTVEKHEDLLKYANQIEEQISEVGYKLKKFIKNGYYGYVFEAERITGRDPQKAAIKVTWDDALLGDIGVSFPLCTKYDKQIQLSKRRTYIFAPIKNIQIPLLTKEKDGQIYDYGVCITIMPLAIQDLETPLSFLKPLPKQNN